MEEIFLPEIFGGNYAKSVSGASGRYAIHNGLDLFFLIPFSSI